MDTVAVGARRRTGNASCDSFAMDALNKLAGLGSMAPAASDRNIGLCDGRTRIRCGLDIMGTVTVCTDGRLYIAAGDRFRMNALAICHDWTVADPAALHDGLVTVALAACRRNNCPIDGRFRIFSRKCGRQITV